jgi:hypothetical protein
MYDPTETDEDEPEIVTIIDEGQECQMELLCIAEVEFSMKTEGGLQVPSGKSGMYALLCTMEDGSEVDVPDLQEHGTQMWIYEYFGDLEGPERFKPVADEATFTALAQYFTGLAQESMADAAEVFRRASSPMLQDTASLLIPKFEYEA